MTQAPTSADITALDRAHVWHPYTQMDAWLGAPPQPVIKAAQGPFLTTHDERELIDGAGSWWVSQLGHGYPRVRDAIHAQLDQMAHVAMAGLVHEPAARLAAELAELTPGDLTRTFYSDNGSTAVEVAVRCAFQYWQQNGRPERSLFVSLAGAYHGDTIGAVSVGGIDTFHDKFAPLVFETIRVPAPTPTWHEQAFATLEATLRERADQVAAVIVEPLVQGAAGMLMYPPSYLARVRALCDELDIFLIADEVFVGFGRTGTLFACEQAGIAPDFMCLSKGLTAGFLPFAATLTTERVFDGFRGDRSRMFHYGHSYCGNPTGAAAALAVLEAYRQDGIMEQAAGVAAQLEAWRVQMAALPGVSDARRTGTVIAVQFGDSASYDASVGWRIYDRALRDGLYMRPLGNVCYLVPALTMPAPVVDRMLSIAGEAIQAEI